MRLDWKENEAITNKRLRAYQWGVPRDSQAAGRQGLDSKIQNSRPRLRTPRH